jgi:hypothetical protein
MWESRRLTTLWALTTPYRDSFIFYPIFTWSPRGLINLFGSEKLQEFGNSKINFLVTHFRNMFICDGKVKKMPND